MQIPKKVVETVNATSVKVCVKACDSGSYQLMGEEKIIAERDDYVPGFFPGDHYGDYLILDIDLESGRILNWKRPDPTDVATAFGLIESEE